MADLSAAGLSDVAAFFRTYYVPNNAILCVAGDLRPLQAKPWIQKYFGPLSRGPHVKPLQRSVPNLSARKHIRSTDAVSLPRAQLIWPTVPANHSDEPALDVLAAVLGGLPKENRLFRALMYDRQLAAGVEARTPPSTLRAHSRSNCTPAPAKSSMCWSRSPTPRSSVSRRKAPLPSRCVKPRTSGAALIMGLQSVTRKASVLAQSMEAFGDPLGYRTELEKVFAVTPEDVTRVARQYLGAKRIELDVLPGAPASRPAEAPVERSKQEPLVSPALAEINDAFDRSVMPRLGPTPYYAPPSFHRRALSNGLKLLIVERHELPIVTLCLIVKSGETSTPKGKEGLSSIAASLLDEGTRTRDSLQIAGELAEIGAALAAVGELESTTISLTTLTRHLERGLDLYADVVLNPLFPEKELNRLKLQRLAQLKARTDDPEQTAAWPLA